MINCINILIKLETRIWKIKIIM